MSDGAFITWSIAVAVALIALIFGVLVIVEKVGCEQRWQQSGYKTSWGIFQGCLVETAPGKWIPERTTRTLQ